MKLLPKFFTGTLRNLWQPWPVRVYAIRFPIFTRWGVGILYAPPIDGQERSHVG